MGESNRVSSLDNYIAYTTVVAETTQKSAESVGESFKTLYARFGKIAAGKFETSQEELEQEGLSSEDMSNLNEIEQVLKAVGIELRDTPEHFRDIDSVLAEIAGKWNTFSDVQKSGIATAVAGTRQRENFLVLMENWDNVGKYAEIAANAYGTAVEKMEAYSQGVEAARKRVQAAWEGFALIVNESGVLEAAFNGLATAIENIHWIILAAITSLIASNPAGAAATLSQAFTKLSLTLGSTGLEQKLGLVGDSQATIEAAKQARIDMADAAFVRQKQMLWGDYLGKFKGGMNDERFSGFSEYQSGLIGLDKSTENEYFIAGLAGFASALQKGKDGTELATKSLDFLKKNIDEGKAQILLNTVSKETANTLVLSQKKHIEEGLTEEQLKDQTTILAEARKRAAMQLLDDMGADKSQYYSESDKKVFVTATGNAQKSRSQSRQKLAISAVGSLFGSIAGGYGGSKGLGGIFASTMGEEARSAGESIGSIIGMVAGQKAVTTLIANWGAKLTGSAVLTGLVAPWAAVIALVAGAGYGLYKHFKKKAIQEAQEDFKELKDTYESQLSASTKTSRYDELSEGVDQFGRNVSLTDEEYSEFLSTSNELAEIFPELVVRTDEAGNSFLGTAGKVNKLTDAVNDMVKASQKAADQQLLNKNVFGEAFDDAKKDQSSTIDTINELEETIKKKELDLKRGYYTIDRGQGRQRKVDITEGVKARFEKEIQDAKKQLVSLQKDLSVQRASSLTDYNNAIMREDFGLQATLSSMSEDSAILAKQTMQKVFSSLDLTQYANEDEYRADIEKISNEIAEIYRDNPIIATMEVEMSSSATSGEYYAVRQKILQNIIDAFGDYATWDDTQKMFVLQMGFKWSEDTGWVDTTDIRQKIKDEGLDSRLVRGAGMLDAFSVSELESAYQILKSSSYGTQFNENQLRSAIFSSENSEAGLKKIVSLYEQYKDLENPTEIDESNLKFLQTQLSLWGKELRVVKSDYSDINDYCDEIARKSKFFGDMDKFGTSTVDPQEVIDKRDKYLKYYNFLKDEYSKTGKWDLDIYDDMIRDSNLQEFVATNDVSGLTNYFEEYFKNFPTDLKNSYQAILWDNADLNKQMQEEHKDLYEAYEKDYGIDLTKFTNMNVAKAAIDKLYSSIMTNSWADWRDAMFMYYGEVLNKYSDMASKIAALNSLMLKDLFTYSSGVDGDEIDEFTDASYTRWYMAGGEAGTGMTSSEWLSKDIRDYQQKKNAKEIENFTKNGVKSGQEILNTMPTGKYDTKDKRTSELGKNIEQIEALIEMYQKEYYLRKSLIEFGNKSAIGQDAYMSKEYYDKMHYAYEEQANYYHKKIPWQKEETKMSAEELGYLQKYQQAMINLKNLDDERVEDKINILQLQDASLDTLIAIQKEYITTSDTLQERLEREQELNNLLEERRKLYRDTQEYERWIADYNISNLKGTAYTNPTLYDQQIGIKKSTIENQQNSLIESIDAAKRRIASHLMQTEGLNAEEAYLKAAQSEEVRSLMKEYYELAKEYSEVIMEAINAKVDEISKKIDNVDKERPKQWTSISQIEKSYDSEVDYINKQIDIYREALKDVSKLNDDQINELVDGLNEAVISLHEAKINRGESIKELQEKQYSAAIAQIDIYKQEIQDAIDAIETAYDKEYSRIKENNIERERAIKLEDLLAAKKKAAQEKERVYKEGIGWTYQSNRSAQKEAQENLDSFYREDKLTDLEETKNADVKRLEQRISDWEAYAKALEYKYGAHDREENQKLLMDLLGVDNMDDVRDKMTGDMTSYVTEAKAGLDNFTELSYDFKGTIEAIYKDYNTIFNDFLGEYKKNLEELQKLYEESLKMEDASGYLGGNDVIVAPYTTPSNSVNRDLLAEMMKNSNEWFEVQQKLASDGLTVTEREALEDRQKELHASNVELAGKLSLVNSNLNKGNWSGETVTVGGKNMQTTAAYVMIDGKAYLPKEAAAKLDSLSKAWHEATTQEEKDRIAAAGKEIGESLGWKRDDATGVWHEDATAKANTKNSYVEVINGQSYVKTSNSSGGRHWSTSSGGGKNSGKGTYSSNDGKYTIGSIDGQNFHDNAKAGDTMTGRDGSTWIKNSDGSTTISKNGTTYTVDKGHADGILGGPITYTGLSMLHGTPSAPEYVLNADQAYTLLRNISTMQIPEYTSLLSNAGETQYILQGDVIIDGTENPENFWDAVTNQMRNRYNVTKNNKRA